LDVQTVIEAAPLFPVAESEMFEPLRLAVTEFVFELFEIIYGAEPPEICTVAVCPLKIEKLFWLKESCCPPEF
jgi:hypothetical protein